MLPKCRKHIGKPPRAAGSGGPRLTMQCHWDCRKRLLLLLLLLLLPLLLLLLLLLLL